MKSKKLISILLIGGMIFSNIMPVYASPLTLTSNTNSEVIDTYTISSSSLESPIDDTLVYYVSAESFSVVIPKRINLNGREKNPQTAFSVSVSGDIEGTSKVNVSSDENFYMKQDGKADVLALVGYQRTFTSAEVIANTTDTSGLVSIPNEDGNALSSGAWSGTFKFYINYESGKYQTSGLYEENGDFTSWDNLILNGKITTADDGKTLSKIDLETNGVLVIGENIEKVNGGSCQFKNIRVVDFSKTQLKTLGNGAFANSKVENIILPNTLESIENTCFVSNNILTAINYNGTIDEWSNISKGERWKDGSSLQYLICKDGKLDINAY